MECGGFILLSNPHVTSFDPFFGGGLFCYFLSLFFSLYIRMHACK